MQKKEIALIVPTFNQKEMTLKNLGLLKKQSCKDFDIIVVDNASEDGTYKEIRKKYPKVKLIRNKENFGGSGAQNIGCKFAYAEGYKYIILSDNDAFPKSNDLIKKLIAPLRNYKEVGAVLPRGEDGLPLKAFHYFSTRRDVIDKLGYPDFNFFLLYDDVIYYRKISEYFKIVHLDKPYYTHKNKKDNFFNKFYLYYDTRNSIRAFLMFPGTFYREMFIRIIRACSLLAYSSISKDKELRALFNSAVYDAFNSNVGRKNFYGKILLLESSKKKNFTISSSKVTLFYPFVNKPFFEKDAGKFFLMKNSSIKFFLFLKELILFGIPSFAHISYTLLFKNSRQKYR